MDFQWQYHHLVLPMSISIFFVLSLIISGLRQRHNPTALPFLLFMVCLLIWLGASLLESITLNLQISLIFADISFLGITFLPIILLWFVSIYNGPGKWFYRALPWLLVIPILTNILIWTNASHHLWRGDSYRDLTTTWFPITIYQYGTWFPLHLIFSLSVTFIAMILLVRSLFFRERAYRIQIIIILVAVGLPVGVEILYQIGITPITYYNTTTLVFPISGLLLRLVLRRHQFLDLTPFARERVIESLQELMLVLDDQGRLVDLNPIARQMLFDGSDAVVGMKLDDLLPEQSQQITHLIANPTANHEIQISRFDEKYIYDIRLSPIIHPFRPNAGWLVLLHDITDRKQAEQASYKQLQQVAILEERQRLARELHDSVNQTLFAARVLADLLPKAIDKKPEKILEYAVNIQQLINGATAEMRLVLLELYPDALSQTDLGTLIHHLCDAYRDSFKLYIDIFVPSQIHLEKEAQIAFYRIAQEALNNINKHTDATKIIVKLIKNDTIVELSIQDNGAGFDTENIPAGHFGLKNMADRAKSAGATFTIVSKMDEGTTVTVAKAAHNDHESQARHYFGG